MASRKRKAAEAMGEEEPGETVIVLAIAPHCVLRVLVRWRECSGDSIESSARRPKRARSSAARAAAIEEEEPGTQQSMDSSQPGTQVEPSQPAEDESEEELPASRRSRASSKRKAAPKRKASRAGAGAGSGAGDGSDNEVDGDDGKAGLDGSQLPPLPESQPMTAKQRKKMILNPAATTNEERELVRQHFRQLAEDTSGGHVCTRPSSVCVCVPASLCLCHVGCHVAHSSIVAHSGAQPD
jgi:hypothetical protein